MRAPIAAVIHPSEERIDGLLEALAGALRAQGRRVSGLVQRYVDAGAGKPLRMMLFDLNSDQQYAISQDLGPGSASCRLYPGGVSEASQVLRKAIQERPDLLVVNRFGVLEAKGQGFVSEMLMAMTEGVPLITAVSATYAEAWHRFCGGIAQTLPPDLEALLAWALPLNPPTPAS